VLVARDPAQVVVEAQREGHAAAVPVVGAARQPRAERVAHAPRHVGEDVEAVELRGRRLDRLPPRGRVDAHRGGRRARRQRADRERRHARGRRVRQLEHAVRRGRPAALAQRELDAPRVAVLDREQVEAPRLLAEPAVGRDAPVGLVLPRVRGQARRVGAVERVEPGAERGAGGGARERDRGGGTRRGLGTRAGREGGAAAAAASASAATGAGVRRRRGMTAPGGAVTGRPAPRGPAGSTNATPGTPRGQASVARLT
jgi:hypothetical protein